MDEPDRTVTLSGTAMAVLLLLNATVVAAVAVPVNVTVQALDEAPESSVGVHASELSVRGGNGTVIVPLVAEIASALPAGEAACTLVTVTAAVWEAVALIRATTPPPIAVAFGPEAKQVDHPPADVHDNDLPAAVSAAPTVTEKPLSAAGGY